MDRQERAVANMEASDSVDTKQSKQRASIKWLLSKAFNNRVPENLQEPFYRDHEDQEHLKPPIVGGLANAELYCLALANMYSDPNYHSLNHWNILQTFSRKGVHISDPPDCALTETVLIQTNPLKMSAHMTVMEALMVLYAKEVVTLDRVSAAAQRFGVGASQLLPVSSNVPHEDGLVWWINAACTALNKAEEDTSSHVPMVKSLQELCDGTSLAALISFYCPEALPRAAVRVGRMASIQDCLHNLMLVYNFCQSYLPHNVFHMMPEDVTYMRGSMRHNLIAMLSDLFNMLEVHPVKSVKYPGSVRAECNEHGVRHKRCLPPPPPTPIPDLRAEQNVPNAHNAPFSVPRSPSACSTRGRAPLARSACSTPERRSVSPQREEFVVHRGRGVTTLSSVARRDDDNMSVECNMTAAGRPSNWADTRDTSFAGRRSRRSSITDDSQLTVENFGGSQDRLHFAGRNPEKELAIVTNVRKISAPAGPLDNYNPPLRSSRQDIRGSIQFFHGDYHNGSDDNMAKIGRQQSQPQPPHELEPPLYPIRRQLSSDTITLHRARPDFTNMGGGDGFYLNSRDTTDSDGSKTSFADLNKIRPNGDQKVMVGMSQAENEQSERRKTTTFSTPAPNTTTWQQQSLQQENVPNGDDITDDRTVSPSGGAMAAQLNNIRLKLEEKRRRIEQDKRRMELAVNRQRQQLGQQAFLQAVTRGKGARTPAEDEPKREHNEKDLESPNQTVDTVALEQYQQSIAKMNSSLQDIQSDIARLANQQTQIQQTQIQQQQAKQLFQQQPQQLPQAQSQLSPYQQHPYQSNIPQLHSQFSSQQNVSRTGINSFGSTPHIPRDYQHQQQHFYHQPEQSYQQYQYRDIEQELGRQFFLHDSPPAPQPTPAPVQRRTWAQHAHAQQETELRGWQLHQPNNQQYHQPVHEPAQRTWKSQSPQPQERSWNPQGFVLHDRTNQPFQVHYNTERYQNGTDNVRDGHNHLTYTVINQNQNQYVSQSPPLAPSPQRRSMTPQRQGSLPEVSKKPDMVSLQQLQTPVPAPPPDDMEPQNISFIGNAEDDAIRQGINRLNISSGTRTYRIPSPTRPSLSRNSFQQLDAEDVSEQNEKGFYISFDNDQPKRPKPPLRAKKGSPKKEQTPSERQSPERSPEMWNDRVPPPIEEPTMLRRSAGLEQAMRSNDVSSERRETPPRERAHRVGSAEPAALVIGDNPDPNSAEEMERKKERIMLMSLQRRQRADEARARAESAAAARRAKDEADAEKKLARKEEQARRREAILHQYKLKKAIEEAEREGKVLDKTELMESLKATSTVAPSLSSGMGTARLRGKPATRARPKTIHVDSGALHAAEGMLATKQPSATNLAAGGTMRRDYYRGSQDSLAERAGLYRESPVEDRGGMSPSSASSGPLGRRGSCKTSRGPRLYKQPTTKSNRGIMLNAVEYCVFPGAVNAEAKRRVLEEIARSESKHFLVLFRDAGCQFRALYSYCPDTEQVAKLYGTGPKQVNDRMFDKFFKYNSGSKCFSQVHTKHLTVTIDAFTIHNSLWQGKKVQLPSKKDMALVI